MEKCKNVVAQGSQQESGQITLQPVLINKSYYTKNAPGILPVRRFSLARDRIIGKKHTVVRNQLSLRNPSVRAFDYHAQGFSTPLARPRLIELSSALAEPGAYYSPPDCRAFHGNSMLTRLL